MGPHDLFTELEAHLTANADVLVRGNPVTARPESGVDNSHPGLEFDMRNMDRGFFPGLLFTAAATVVAALVFGIVPAINASRPDLNSCLKDRGACASNPGQRRLRHTIVVGEVALAMVLLVGAGLMYRSVESLEAVDLGFEPQGVLTYRISLPQVPYDDVDKRAAALAKIESRVADLPGVKATGSTQVLPLGGQFWTSPYQVPLEAQGATRAGEADYRYVTPGLEGFFGLLPGEQGIGPQARVVGEMVMRWGRAREGIRSGLN